MVITTTYGIEGHQVDSYMGVVSAAQILGLGGGNKGVQRGWQAGVDAVNTILAEQATALGADAVLSVRYLISGPQICATGTAVKLDNAGI